MQRAPKTPSATTTTRTLSILEVLAASNRGFSMPELARRLQLPRSSVHVLLLTLERAGYLCRSEKTKRYRIGLRVFDLANMALNGIGLREKATLALRDLGQATGLTVHLGILQQGEGVVIDKWQPFGCPQLATWVGRRMDIHCTALGKSLVAYLPHSELDRTVRAHGLPCYNDNTITSMRRLMVDLMRVRQMGYSMDNEEGEIGFRCLGSTIFDTQGRPVAAISVAGPSSQLARENVAFLVAPLRKATAALSTTLHSTTAANGDGMSNSPTVSCVEPQADKAGACDTASCG